MRVPIFYDDELKSKRSENDKIAFFKFNFNEFKFVAGKLFEFARGDAHSQFKHQFLIASFKRAKNIF